MVTWATTLDETGEGTRAWLFSLRAIGPLATLPPTGRDRHDVGARHGADARRFLARRAVVRHLVARRCDVPVAAVEIGYGPDGAPLVLAPERRLFCSAAARGDLAAVALADSPVGVDLEPIEPGPIPAAVLTDVEQASLAGLDPTARAAAFLHLWTAKEAYLKACRTGLHADPAGIAVSVDPPRLQHGAFVRPLALESWRSEVIDGRMVLAACLSLPAKRAPLLPFTGEGPTRMPHDQDDT